MAQGWRHFTGAAPNPQLAANADQTSFAYGVKLDRQFRLPWLQIRDAEQERELLAFVAEQVGERPPALRDAADWLRDGVVLCRLLQKMAPGCLGEEAAAHLRRGDRLGALANLQLFRERAAHLGLEPGQLFEVSDVVDGRRLDRVFRCLQVICEEIRTRVSVKIYY